MTTVKPLPSVKLATAAVKCEMAAEKSYMVWHQMMRELADKEIKRQREVDQERQVFEVAKSTIAKRDMDIANLKDENERLRYEVEILRPIADDGMTNSFLMAQGEDKLANAEAEIKRLKHELHQAQSNTQNIPTNGSQDALDSLKEYSQGRLLAEKYEKVLRQIADEDISSTKAFFASAKMKQWAKEVLGE